jgi:uncharacterized protein (TIGR03435 family)
MLSTLRRNLASAHKLLLLASVGIAIATSAAIAQAASALHPQTPTAPANSMTFDVVSIRPDKGDDHWLIGATENEYHALDLPLLATIKMAYFSQGVIGSGNKVLEAPDWVNKDRYDIVGKVAQPDLAEWQKQRLALSQKVMLQTMLQNLLAERCKLVTHSIPSEASGYALVVAKHGSKLKDMPAGETPPAGVHLLGGGVIVPYKRGEAPQVGYYGVSMAAFAHQLMGMTGTPVVDQTGLSGMYDFVLHSMDETQPPTSDNPYLWDFRALGLELKPVKVPAETIVIDHIERPTEN